MFCSFVVSVDWILCVCVCVNETLPLESSNTDPRIRFLLYFSFWNNSLTHDDWLHVRAISFIASMWWWWWWWWKWPPKKNEGMKWNRNVVAHCRSIHHFYPIREVVSLHETEMTESLKTTEALKRSTLSARVRNNLEMTSKEKKSLASICDPTVTWSECTWISFCFECFVVERARTCGAFFVESPSLNGSRPRRRWRPWNGACGSTPTTPWRCTAAPWASTGWPTPRRATAAWNRPSSPTGPSSTWNTDCATIDYTGWPRCAASTACASEALETSISSTSRLLWTFLFIRFY